MIFISGDGKETRLDHIVRGRKSKAVVEAFDQTLIY
jgi:hypothetical protein